VDNDRSNFVDWIEVIVAKLAQVGLEVVSLCVTKAVQNGCEGRRRVCNSNNKR
jgi:hypothetical protein